MRYLRRWRDCRRVGHDWSAHSSITPHPKYDRRWIACSWCHKTRKAEQTDEPPAVARVKTAAQVVRDAAEELFYDGDTDRPRDGYYALLDYADRIEARPVRGGPKRRRRRRK